MDVVNVGLSWKLSYSSQNALSHDDMFSHSGVVRDFVILYWCVFTFVVHGFKLLLGVNLH
jgi:hypothetical protein